MYCRSELWTRWGVAATVLMALAILFDVIASLSPEWSTDMTDTSYTSMGLFRFCNGTRVVTRREKKETTRSDASCVYTVNAADKWAIWSFGLQMVALICTVMCFFTLIAFLIGHRYDWFKSRSILVILMPMAILAGAFNVTGCISFGVNMKNIGYSISSGLALDCCSTIFYALFVVAGLLDMHGCCIPRRHGFKNLSKPF